MQTIDAQIQNALHQGSPEAAMRDIKHAVARELQSLDPKTEIKSTDYFNHTFIPDFVLTWGSGGQRPSRDVYLRFSVDAPLIQRDLKSLHEDSPAFISIAGGGRSRREPESVAYEYDDCLLSSTSTLEAISKEDPRTPVTQMLKASLLQGGKGYLVGAAAAEVQEAVSSTDAALTRLDGPAVAASVRAMSEHLSPGFSSRIERVMQVMWVSQGGDAENFPGTHEMVTSLSSGELTQILPFLLSLEDVANIEFWRNLGENLALGHLQELEHWPGSGNLNLLVNANLDRLNARAAAVDQIQPNLFDELDGPPYWEVADSHLHLRCGDVDFKFVDDRRKIAHRTELGIAPRWFEIEHRLDRYGIEGIEFTSPGTKTRIRSSTTEGLRESMDMQALSEALGEYARVMAVELRWPRSRHNIEIDFDRFAVESVGSSISLHILAFLGLDLLYQAPSKALRSFQRFVTVDDKFPWWNDKGVRPGALPE
ncbi:hypothetical protein KVH02_11410 [Streptomyces olivaceus]|uniref:Uncharacterized protein n=1 Tax=Streptomyces olivaceus TaxID=47716 RepID=A0ABS7W0L3_STROV|nr:hypothetical protein [Streptomyces olivaceus]MBZ6088930.1 hypothetical protein [Streptomyces olivaceus]MBZ6095696.1 hypothetical protein [Streptomyces olivaceus]MBZ6119965.1 hypothetical protein [Streptomyces olivaceus]MBZ6151516.1 hypothetical protein [Streptomyces olivaceus]MBZ6298362.1 hypothetical protein [Streptomyces olivaceus]